jgi:hypothetical protein
LHIFPTYSYSDQTCCAKELKLNCIRLVHPVIAYGAETWTLRATDELTLQILERRIMRRIYGPKFAQGNWHIRTNSKINELIGHDNIIGCVKTLTLKWLGHVERMHSGRVPKMILKARMEGGRKEKGKAEEAMAR